MTDLDRWALSEVHRLAAEVDEAMESFDPARAGKALAAYIDDLSNWYVRRSRRRFWDGDAAALSTLHECLNVLTRLLAPFIPFVTEKVWDALFSPQADTREAGIGGAASSVHLASWPVADPSKIDTALSEQIGLVRRLVELGRSARNDSNVKTRQPLAQALISAPGWAAMPERLRSEVADELNVVALATLDSGSEDLVDISIKPNFRNLGKRFGNGTQGVAKAISAADPREFATALAAGSATVVVDGADVSIEADDVVVTETPRSGWAVASAGAETVALDLELTHELRLAGLVREVVRLVQQARKDAGLEVTDRIALWWRVGGSPEPAEAIRTHGESLASEVLATSVTEGAPADGFSGYTAEDEDLGLTLWLAKA